MLHLPLLRAAALASLLFTSQISANDMHRRQESSSSTAASSSASSGSMSAASSSVASSATSTSTISQPSTVSASPPNTSDAGDLVTSTFTGSTIAPTATAIPGSDLATCETSETQPGLYPFCRPVNNSAKTVSSMYSVTWDSSAFSNGTQVTINLTPFPNTDNTVTWHSPPTDKNLGFVYLLIDPAWLDGGNQTSYSMSLISNNPSEPVKAAWAQGPMINVVPVPPPPPPPPPPRSSATVLGLALGIPLAFLLVGFVLAVLYFGMRSTRHIGLGNVMGRRKGYGVSKSRIQRLGKRGDFGLSEQEAYASEPAFRDDPTAMELGDGRYTDSSREERSRNAGNVFREEIARQQDLR